MIKAYKIVETDDSGNIKTLFHGVNGSRVIKLGAWIQATEKMVKDGSSKTKYLSGWHVLLHKNDAKEYLKSFKKRLDKLKIVEVIVKGIRPKSHSNHPVYLAKEMFVNDKVYV